MVVVKESIGRFAASNLHPTVACELLQAGAERAVHNLGKMQPPPFQLPVTMEITFLVADMAEMATWIRGVERVAARTVHVASSDLLDLYRTFVTIVTLTRSLVDR
jgi:D-amino peptidase